MPGPLRVTDSVLIPEVELTWRFSRSSGPTTALSDALRARALERLATRLVDGRITVTASEHRSQLRNREAAEQRLAALLRAAIAPPPRKRRPTRATKGSVKRRLEEKRRRSELKKLRRSEGTER
jgi:ribosome-associated protein